MLSRRRFMNDRIASESGDNLVLQNVKGSKMNALTVYGKSTQDGTPSPENPVPIVSAGDDGEINVSVSDEGTQSQTLTFSTPGGLPGIPVSSGGNYTDANGQQWICDEVDFKRGVYVQRIIRYTGPYLTFQTQSGNYYIIAVNLDSAPNPICKGFCNMSQEYNPSWEVLENSHWFLQQSSQQIIIQLGEKYNSEEATQQFIDENEIVVYYVTYTPIETPLSPSELAAYAALRTYSPTTVVSNDAGAWMKVGYREWRR